MALIGISGKMQSGKNTVASIIQYLTNPFDRHVKTEFNFNEDYSVGSQWQQKAFADKLKQIVSILTGIPVEDLEKQKVKDSLLPSCWDYLVYDIEEVGIYKQYRVRGLLQKLGTEAMRDVIHPNIWVNALFTDYISKYINQTTGKETLIGNYEYYKSGLDSKAEIVIKKEPNWIITDMRFSNELQAVKDRGGITIRVNRNLSCEVCKFTKSERRGKICNEIACPQGRENYQGKHPSETSLDLAEFDYVIDNNAGISELIEKVKQILIKEKII